MKVHVIVIHVLTNHVEVYCSVAHTCSVDCGVDFHSFSLTLSLSLILSLPLLPCVLLLIENILSSDTGF